MRALSLMLALLLQVAAAHGQALALPPQHQTTFDQHLGRQLPLQTMLVDEQGRPVRLGSFFGDTPVIVVFGYYHCPNLCSTLMEGVLQTLAALDLPTSSYRLVGISIDPTETPAMAAAKEAGYRPLLPGVDMHLLTGSGEATHRLASVAGFHYWYDKASKQYVHPSGFLIATPKGVISRYFMGVRFDQEAVRKALQQAAGGGIGALAHQLLLLCCSYDPATGKYSITIMNVIRLVCFAIVAVLGGWIALRLRPRRRAR